MLGIMRIGVVLVGCSLLLAGFMLYTPSTGYGEPSLASCSMPAQQAPRCALERMSSPRAKQDSSHNALSHPQN